MPEQDGGLAMITEYADIWVYPNRIEVRQGGRVIESVEIEPQPNEAWRDLVLARVAPAVETMGYRHNGWHRPRNNDAVLATTFAWRDR